LLVLGAFGNWGATAWSQNAARPFFLIVYTGSALAILKNTTDGTTLFGRPALQDFEGL
jgi:hypothetical protein